MQFLFHSVIRIISFHLLYRYLALEICTCNLEELVCGNYNKTLYRQIVDPIPEILQQIVSGVNHLHLQKIVHGDLKPSNILFSFPKGNLGPKVKITGFGLRHIKFDDEEMWFRPAFTEGWMCPSDALDEEEQRCPSFDIFALGLVFGFSASNGVLPFGSDLRMSITRIKNKRPMMLLLGQLDETVRIPSFFQLIDEMVDFDASKRPTASEILDHEFFQQKFIVQPMSEKIEETALR